MDLSLLLASDASNSDYFVSFDPTQKGGFSVKQKSRKIDNIDIWVKAFTVFISINAENQATAHEVVGLMTYMNEIQSMAKDGYDFSLYDYHYRQERSCRSDKP